MSESPDFEDRLKETDFAVSLFLEWDNAIYAAVAIALILAARYLYAVPFWFMTGKGFFKPEHFKLNEQLIEKDNKAIAISLGAFIVALGICLNGIIGTGADNKARNLAAVFIWAPIMIFLLFVARFFNLFMIIRSADSVSTMISQSNVAVACVEAGAVLGSAMIIRATTLADPSDNFWEDLGSTFLYFCLGQILFVIWSVILDKFVSQIGLQQQLLNKNIAAGTSFGLNLFAFGYLLSIPISNTDSFVGFIVWAGFGAVATYALRFVVNKLLLWGEDLDKEIVEDHNWGAALIEGSALLMVTMVCDTFVGLDTGNNVVNCGK